MEKFGIAMMKMKKLYIYTIGCQMNVYDSELFARVLQPSGYEKTEELDEADLVIVNTCSIRQKAEEKAFSFLGRMPKFKKRKPSLIVGIGGCVAQQEGEKILQRMPHVDLVFGTQVIPRLAEHVASIEKTGKPVVDVANATIMDEVAAEPLPGEETVISKFVTIMQGCDNFCTYCVVPYTRGREKSRKPEHIVAEIEKLVQAGVKEVTLLGQNVNSYGQKEGLCSFAELLTMIDAIEGLERIRFATSHPKDLSDDLIEAFRTLPKLCKHIHLPVQSGSNRILKRMNRRYTREIYLSRIEKLRAACPEIAVTSDMIVSFPSETEEEFEETLSLMREVRFDSLFAFIYSDRPNAPAAKYDDKVDPAESKRRIMKLLELQETYTRKSSDAYLGKTCEILVEGVSRDQGRGKAEGEQWTGRTDTGKIVNFPWDAAAHGEMTPGKKVTITVEKVFSNSLWGTRAGG